VLDADTVIRSPHSATDPRTSVSMKTLGLELVAFFDDHGRQGPIREVRLLPPGDDKELEPGALREFAPRWPLYANYARAAMTSADGDWQSSLLALREIGTTRRGLPPEHFRRVAAGYRALLAEGERHPVKALSEIHHVTISTASRWITETRNRGLLDDPPVDGGKGRV